jgi:hypothetical protein
MSDIVETNVLDIQSTRRFIVDYWWIRLDGMLKNNTYMYSTGNNSEFQ